MPTFYTLYQDNREKSLTRGKWYARAKSLGYWDLDKLADHIQDNVSAKKSDVIAVLKELVVVMAEAFDSGYGVSLDGFGKFKIGLRTKPRQVQDRTAHKACQLGQGVHRGEEHRGLAHQLPARDALERCRRRHPQEPLHHRPEGPRVRGVRGG